MTRRPSPAVAARRDAVLALLREHEPATTATLWHLERRRAGKALGRTGAPSPVIDQLWPDIAWLERAGLIQRTNEIDDREPRRSSIVWRATEPAIDMTIYEAAFV